MVISDTGQFDAGFLVIDIDELIRRLKTTETESKVSVVRVGDSNEPCTGDDNPIRTVNLPSWNGELKSVQHKQQTGGYCDYHCGR